MNSRPDTAVSRARFVAKFNARLAKYCLLGVGALKLADNAVGTVVEELKTQGMWASTVLVFISDNGGSPTDGGNNWQRDRVFNRIPDPIF